MIGATISNTANPTQLAAGHKVNVIPGEATAHVDGRFLPGHEQEFLRQIESPFADSVDPTDHQAIGHAA